MKRYVFITLIAALFVFFGCSNFVEHDVEIENKSDYTVSFQLKGYGEASYTLNSNEAITLQIYNNPTLLFQDNPRVRYETTSNVVIYNLNAYNYQILNTSNIEITLEETNGLLGNSYGDTVTLAPAESAIVTVYTKKPIWKAFYTDYDKTDAVNKLSIIRL